MTINYNLYEPGFLLFLSFIIIVSLVLLLGAVLRQNRRLKDKLKQRTNLFFDGKEPAVPLSDQMTAVMTLLFLGGLAFFMVYLAFGSSMG